jgi:hypothetical protein
MQILLRFWRQRVFLQIACVAGAHDKGANLKTGESSSGVKPAAREVHFNRHKGLIGFRLIYWQWPGRRTHRRRRIPAQSSRCIVTQG